MVIQNTSSMVQAVRLPGDASGSATNSAPVVGTPVVAPDRQPEKPSAPAKPAESKPTDPQLQKSLDHINTVLLKSNINIQFNVDASSQKAVLKLIDTQTGEIIRQFPTDAALSISRSIDQFQQGLLLNQKA